MAHTQTHSCLGNVGIAYLITTLKPKSFIFSLCDVPFFGYLGNFSGCRALVNILSLGEPDIFKIQRVKAKLGGKGAEL